MKKTMIATAVLVGVAASGLAGADEVWSTEIGDVIYETDLENGMAVLSYPTDGDIRGLAYVAGLAGQFEGRTAYEGIWMEPPTEEGICAVEIAAPETGEISNNWGRIRVVFVDPDFPGTFVAMRGECFSEPNAMLVARPVVAGRTDHGAE